MNRLQKKAWIELAAVTFYVPVIGLGLAVLVRSNASGPIWLIVSLLVGLPTGFYYYLKELREQKKLDEREKQIAQKAFVLSTYVFVMFILCSGFTLFFVVGAAGRIPVYSIPVLLVVGIFVAQFAESATILIQFAREQTDG